MEEGTTAYEVVRILLEYAVAAVLLLPLIMLKQWWTGSSELREKLVGLSSIAVMLRGDH